MKSRYNSGKTDTNKFRLNKLMQILPDYIDDMEVLEIGCYKSPLLREYIHSLSRLYVGVDIDKNIRKLNLPYLICKDILELNLNRKFDVIFAGELIEHLANHKKFLEVCIKHLKKDGLLILTTPNPYFFGRFLDIIKRGEPHVSRFHYCYFCPKTLTKLLDDHNFKVLNLIWLNEFSSKRLGYLPLKFREWFSSNFMLIAKNVQF